MRVIINKNSIFLKIWFFITVLLELDFFGVILMPTIWYSINSVGRKSLIIAMTIIVIFVSHKGSQFYHYKEKIEKTLRQYIYVVLGCVLLCALFSFYTYREQSVFQLFRTCEHFLCILMVIPIGRLFIIEDGYQKMFGLLGKIFFIYFIIIIIQTYMYNTYDSVIMQSYFASNIVGSRSGSVRIIMSFLANIIIIYEFDKFFNNRFKGLNDRFFSIIFLVLGLYNVFFITMTRIYTVSVLAAFVFIFLYSNNRINTFIKKMIMAVTAVGVLIGSDLFTTFISTFQGNSSLESVLSAQHKIQSVSYYWESFLSNPLFGMGFISDASDSYLPILMGSNRMFYLSDVGVFGLLAQMGLTGLFLYLFILFRMWKTLRIIKTQSLQHKYSYLYGVFIFIIITSVSTIITDNYRIFSLPLVICIFEYVRYYCLREAKNEI